MAGVVVHTSSLSAGRQRQADLLSSQASQSYIGDPVSKKGEMGSQPVEVVGRYLSISEEATLQRQLLASLFHHVEATEAFSSTCLLYGLVYGCGYMIKPRINNQCALTSIPKCGLARLVQA